jgi:hypothetical protein
MELEWKQVCYYCGHLLAYCISPELEIMMIVEQLVEWMSGRRIQSALRKPSPLPLCQPQTPRGLTPDSNPVRRSRKPASARLNYGTAQVNAVREKIISQLSCFYFSNKANVLTINCAYSSCTGITATSEVSIGSVWEVLTLQTGNMMLPIERHSYWIS